MKYLKKYKHFENIEVSAKDEPDVKLAKEEANDLEEKLKEFPAIKAELDKAFTDIKSDKDNEVLNKRIDEIKKKFPDNPFIEEYTHMMNIQIKIKHIQEELLKYNDDLFKNEEDLKQISTDKGDITAKSKTINDIKTAQKVKNQEVSDLKKELLVAEKDMEKRMDDIKKEMQDSSQKIATI